MEKTRDATAMPVTGLLETPPIPDDLRARPIALTDNARVVLQKRYLRRGSDGKPAETEPEMFWRVAYNVALAEDKHNGDVMKNARAFYDLLTNLQFFPNSPTFTGAGTPLGQLAACFTEDMRVTTSVGLKRIADLLPGDLVLTHKGHYRPVKEVYKREYADTLLEVSIKKIGTPLKVTPEHPILTSRGWVKAGELKVGDWVAAGMPQGEWGITAFDMAALEFPVELELQQTENAVRVRRPSTYQNSGVQARWVNRFVEATPELARLCGYYISEGTLGTECEYLRFTFSKDETDYHQDVVSLIERVFGAPATIRPSNHGHWVQIDVYSRAIATWFKANFGTHSYGKYLPAWMQFLPAEHQKQFLIGILRSDGLFYEKKHTNGVKFRSLRLTLSNPSLISQVWQMCLRYGFDASIRACDTTYVTPNARDTASLNIPPFQAQDFVEEAFGRKFSPMDMRYTRSDVTRIEGQPFFQVKSITSSDFTGIVYNCEVEEDHTYVTEGVIVHNCFVLRIDDDMGRSDTGIFQTLRNAALIQQTGGGNGFAFSRLRPKGAIVKSSNGQATGPVGFLRVYDQAFGEIAQGGCLTPDTLVHTEKGLLRLDEIVTHQEHGWREHSLTVATDEGERTSTQAYNNGVVPVLRLTTEEGIEITGTPNHKFKVMSESGPVWRRLDELRPGDALMVKLGQHQGQLQMLQKPIRQHGNQVMPQFPTHLNEEFAFFMGYMVGDGFVAAGADDHRVGVTVAHDSYLMEEMPAMMRRLFGEQVTIHTQQKPNDASITFVIDNRAVKDFFILNGLVKGRSTNAHIPRLIRQSTPMIVGAFLSGLFEADGALSHGYPSLMSSSEILIRETATMLIGLGCPITLRQQTMTESHYGTAQMWQLRLNSYVSLQAWCKLIGCDSRSRFSICYTFEPDLARESSYILPHPAYWIEPVLTATAKPQIDRRGTGRNLRATDPKLRKQMLRYTRGDRQLTLSGYTLMAEKNADFAQHARPVINTWFTIVQNIEPAGDALTLDIEVEQNHTYLANGLVTHNSRRGANMAVLRVDHPDVREFITCKTDESHITNFNISVGISDLFMTRVLEDGNFDLINPQDGKVWETVRAREIFDLIVKQAHHNGEPGVLFLDAANRQNPVPHLYELESTNPCVPGETRVATPQGWKRVDSIRESDEICTVSGVGRVQTVEINEAIPVYKVRLSDGGTIRATAAHQFHVWNKTTSTFQPVRLDMLRAGDQLRVHRPDFARTFTIEAAQSVNGDVAQATLAVMNIEQGLAEILSITPDGIERVYDLYEPISDTWITEGYVSRGCGEQFLGPFENCCLGSINLVNVNTPDGKVNWAQLQELTETSTRFLDDVVTANKYVPAVPQLEEAAHAVRRIGLGIMGLGDLMYKCGIRYGSEEGQEFAGQVMEFVRFHAMQTSIALAQERGAFPAIKGSLYDPENLKWQPPTPLFPYERDLSRPKLDWSEIVSRIKRYGIRNGCQTTVAPTGTIATVSGCEAYGCEPVFALAYTRHVNDKGQDLKLQYTSPLFQKALEEAGLDAAQIKTIVEQVNVMGSCQDVEGIPENVRHTFVVSSDISVEEHIRMQAAMQAFVDNAISKTVNAPNNATLSDVEQAYMLGWKLGCKGMTVYVTGSREKVVLETHATAQAKQKDDQPAQVAVVSAATAPAASVSQPAPVKIFGHLKKSRPRRLAGRTYQVGTPLGKTYITVNENGEGRGQPFEIFTHTSKAGSETAAVSEAIGRLISLVLRVASPISPRERLAEIVQQLIGIGGGRSSGFGAARVRSLPDGVAQALQEYLDETSDVENLVEPVEVAPKTISDKGHHNGGNGNGAIGIKSAVGVNNGKIVGDLCPECGEATLINEEGCRKCYTCSYSEC